MSKLIIASVVLIAIVGIGAFVFTQTSEINEPVATESGDRALQKAEEKNASSVDTIEENVEGAGAPISGETNVSGDDENVNVNASQELVTSENDSVEPNSQTTVGASASNANDSAVETTAPPAAQTPGTFQSYSEDKLALAESGDVVLFFHATWCPSCKALEEDINDNLESIPPNLHILKVDYDSSSELRKKYGVTRQHTLVPVDQNGNQAGDQLPYWLLTLESVVETL